MNIIKSDAEGIAMCKIASEGSDDEDTKVGCIITNLHNEVLIKSCNKLPYGISYSKDKISRPGKYTWIEHAERNAIYEAALKGYSLNACKMYLNWFPCIDCTRAIIQSGIKNLIVPNKPDFNHHRWGEQFKLSYQMLKEADIFIKDSI